ncbi:unnamed protein product, partial [Durusdinium trenchii]
WGAAAAFSPGDCAFVGIYGDKDDFAVLLLEDVNGESLSLTDANFKDRDLKVDQWQWAEAKAHVKDAQKGTILRKWDFDTNSQNAFAAPVSLTVIKGSPGMTESPSVLCGINMAQPQNRQLSTSNGLELVEAETAEYVGPKFGTKEDLFQSMTDPSNWGRQSRQLSSFTVLCKRYWEEEKTQDTWLWNSVSPVELSDSQQTGAHVDIGAMCPGPRWFFGLRMKRLR